MRKRFRIGFAYVCLLSILLNVIPYVLAGKSQEYSYSGNILKDELAAARKKDQDKNADYDMDHRDETERVVLNRKKRSNDEINPSRGERDATDNDPAASGSEKQEENSDVKLISDTSGRRKSVNVKEKRNVARSSKKRSPNRKISSASQKGSLDSRVQLSNLNDKVNQDNGEYGPVDDSRVESDDGSYDDDGPSAVDDETVGQSDKGDAPGNDARSSDESLEKIDSDRVSLDGDPEAKIVKRDVDREEEYEEIDDRDAVRNSVGLTSELEQDPGSGNEEALRNSDKARTAKLVNRERDSENVEEQEGEILKRGTGGVLENSKDENQEKKDSLKSDPDQGESREPSEDLKRSMKFDSGKNNENLNDEPAASGDSNLEISKNSGNQNLDSTKDSEDSKRERKEVNEKGVSKESEEQPGNTSKDKESESNLENENAFENVRSDEGNVDMDTKDGESEADYEKRVERQIQRKIDSIKEEIKREVEEKQKVREIEENNEKYDELQSQEDEDENSQSLDTALEEQQQQASKRSARQVASKRPLERSRRRISKRAARSENPNVEQQLREIEKVDKLDPSVYEKAHLLHESIRKRSTPLKSDVSDSRDENKFFVKKREVPRRVTLVESEPLKNRRKRKSKRPIMIPEQAQVSIQDDLPSDLMLDPNLKLNPSGMDSSRIKRNAPGYERSRRSGAAASRRRGSSLRYRPQLDDENDDGNEFDDNGFEDSTSNLHSRVYPDSYSSLVQPQEADSPAEYPGSYLFANREAGNAMRRKRGGFDSKRRKRALLEPANENKMESVASLVGSSQELSPKLANEYKEAFGGLQADPGGALARFKRIKRVLRVS
ncbi:uncharacterized protein DDB_G0290685 [Cephus cinctus]|uniref:Uncharacterized protein DDB_G0290685 n=1 Tax=Cephus cinctus TaxID=211228 RepID=A0AAJ7BGW3_CEPCN|nr:uncharacterized protein DDB_G0290685 [Cephus cinctus]